MGFADGSMGKEYACKAGYTGDVSSIPDQKDSPEEKMTTLSNILA